MKRLRFIAAAAFAAGIALLALAATGGDKQAATKGGPSLEALKALAGGQWVRISEDGTPTDSVVAVYRITAAGSAVVETLQPGTEDEMLTVYHKDGKDLVMVHYCSMGNQPHMRARRDTPAGTIAFVCDGKGTNMASEKDLHMHQDTLTILGADRIRTEWVANKDGKADHTATFELVRVPSAPDH